MNSKNNKFKGFSRAASEMHLSKGSSMKNLNELFKYYKETDIITKTKNIPKIKYFDNTDRYYFPDIYIPGDNLIIEVKSEYTYNSQISRNLLKKAATEKCCY